MYENTYDLQDTIQKPNLFFSQDYLVQLYNGVPKFSFSFIGGNGGLKK